MSELREKVFASWSVQRARWSRREISDKELEEYSRGIPALFSITKGTWAAWKAHYTRGTYNVVRPIARATEIVRVAVAPVSVAQKKVWVKGFGALEALKPTLTLVPPQKETPMMADDDRRMQKMFEEENVRLEAQKEDLITRLQRSDSQLRAVREQNKLLEAELALRMKTVPSDMEKELFDARGALKIQTEEIRRLKEVARNIAPASTRLGLRASEDFLKVRNSLRALWQADVLNQDEVVAKLMEWEPKE